MLSTIPPECCPPTCRLGKLLIYGSCNFRFFVWNSIKMINIKIWFSFPISSWTCFKICLWFVWNLYMQCSYMYQAGIWKSLNCSHLLQYRKISTDLVVADGVKSFKRRQREKLTYTKNVLIQRIFNSTGLDCIWKQRPRVVLL